MHAPVLVASLFRLPGTSAPKHASPKMATSLNWWWVELLLGGSADGNVSALDLDLDLDLDLGLDADGEDCRNERDWRPDGEDLLVDDDADEAGDTCDVQDLPGLWATDGLREADVWRTRLGG